MNLIFYKKSKNNFARNLQKKFQHLKLEASSKCAGFLGPEAAGQIEMKLLSPSKNLMRPLFGRFCGRSTLNFSKSARFVQLNRNSSVCLKMRSTINRQSSIKRNFPINDRKENEIIKKYPLHFILQNLKYVHFQQKKRVQTPILTNSFKNFLRPYGIPVGITNKNNEMSLLILEFYKEMKKRNISDSIEDNYTDTSSSKNLKLNPKMVEYFYYSPSFFLLKNQRTNIPLNTKNSSFKINSSKNKWLDWALFPFSSTSSLPVRMGHLINSNEKRLPNSDIFKEIERRENSEKFHIPLIKYSKLHEFKLVNISLASPEKIKEWSEKILPNGKIFGEVTNANTLHYKTFKPHKGGLFCERIFGPLKDFECACGISSKPNELDSKKILQHEQIKRIFCPNCDVEYTWSVIRRYQLGYIKLVSPVTHLWYLKANPSYLSLLLDFKRSFLESIIYCTQSITLENIFKNLQLTNYLDTSPKNLYSLWQKLIEEEKRFQIKSIQRQNQKKFLSLKTFINPFLFFSNSKNSFILPELKALGIGQKNFNQKILRTYKQKKYIFKAANIKIRDQSFYNRNLDNNLRTKFDIEVHSAFAQPSEKLEKNISKGPKRAVFSSLFFIIRTLFKPDKIPLNKKNEKRKYRNSRIPLLIKEELNLKSFNYKTKFFEKYMKLEKRLKLLHIFCNNISFTNKSNFAIILKNKKTNFTSQAHTFALFLEIQRASSRKNIKMKEALQPMKTNFSALQNKKKAKLSQILSNFRTFQLRQFFYFKNFPFFSNSKRNYQFGQAKEISFEKLYSSNITKNKNSFFNNYFYYSCYKMNDSFIFYSKNQKKFKKNYNQKFLGRKILDFFNPPSLGIKEESLFKSLPSRSEGWDKQKSLEQTFSSQEQSQKLATRLDSNDYSSNQKMSKKFFINQLEFSLISKKRKVQTKLNNQIFLKKNLTTFGLKNLYLKSLQIKEKIFSQMFLFYLFEKNIEKTLDFLKINLSLKKPFFLFFLFILFCFYETPNNWNLFSFLRLTSSMGAFEGSITPQMQKMCMTFYNRNVLNEPSKGLAIAKNLETKLFLLNFKFKKLSFKNFLVEALTIIVINENFKILGKNLLNNFDKMNLSFFIRKKLGYTLKNKKSFLYTSGVKLKKKIEKCEIFLHFFDLNFSINSKKKINLFKNNFIFKEQCFNKLFENFFFYLIEKKNFLNSEISISYNNKATNHIFHSNFKQIGFNKMVDFFGQKSAKVTEKKQNFYLNNSSFGSKDQGFEKNSLWPTPFNSMSFISDKVKLTQTIKKPFRLNFYNLFGLLDIYSKNHQKNQFSEKNFLPLRANELFERKKTFFLQKQIEIKFKKFTSSNSFSRDTALSFKERSQIISRLQKIADRHPKELQSEYLGITSQSLAESSRDTQKISQSLLNMNEMSTSIGHSQSDFEVLGNKNQRTPQELLTVKVLEGKVGASVSPKIFAKKFSLSRKKNNIKNNLNLKFPQKIQNPLYTISYSFAWSSPLNWKSFIYYNFSSKKFEDKEIKCYRNRNFHSTNMLSQIRSSSYNVTAEIPMRKSTFVAKAAIVENSIGKIKTPKDIFQRNLLKDSLLMPEKKQLETLTGASLIQKLLTEFDSVELKKMMKQHQILIPMLNRSIRKCYKYMYFIKENKEIQATKLQNYRAKIQKLLQKRDYIIRRLKFLSKLAHQNTSPKSMVLTVLPVLPPDLRPILKLQNQIAASDLNRLYQRILYRNERFKKFLKDPSTSQSFEMKYAQRLLQESVDNLIENGKGGVKPETNSRGQALKSLSEILKGKQGRFRQYLLGKRVDYSGRSVIVVGPQLKLSECGLPWRIAIELFLPFLVQKILHYKLAKTVIGAKNFISSNQKVTWNLLNEIMKNHPILLNRAPTLHRLGIQAFIPKLIHGKAILLHPLVCPAFNADFDGDQMAVHVPITVEARTEAWSFLFSRNHLLSAATGEPIVLPSQDMVLGCYYLTSENLSHSLFKSLLPIKTMRKLHMTDFNDFKTNYTSLKQNKTVKQLKNSATIFTSLKLNLQHYLKRKSFSDWDSVLNAYQTNQISLQSIIWMKWNGKTEFSNESFSPLEIQIQPNGHYQKIQSKLFIRYKKLNNLKTNSFNGVYFSQDQKLWTETNFSIKYIRTTAGKVLINNIIKNCIYF